MFLRKVSSVILRAPEPESLMELSPVWWCFGMVGKGGVLANGEIAELLRERDKPLVLDMKPEDFAKRNSGRLVAKFLLSFLPLNEVRVL
jgi:hypothetical protein